MSVKIQINSIEALERLIGGDSAFEIEVRNSVVQDFSKKHLKAVAQVIETDEIRRLIRDELRTGYSQRLKAEDRDKVKSVLHPIIAEIVRDIVREQRDELQEMVNKRFDDLQYELRRFAPTTEDLGEMLKIAVKKQLAETLANL